MRHGNGKDSASADSTVSDAVVCCCCLVRTRCPVGRLLRCAYFGVRWRPKHQLKALSRALRDTSTPAKIDEIQCRRWRAPRQFRHIQPVQRLGAKQVRRVRHAWTQVQRKPGEGGGEGYAQPCPCLRRTRRNPRGPIGKGKRIVRGRSRHGLEHRRASRFRVCSRRQPRPTFRKASAMSIPPGESALCCMVGHAVTPSRRRRCCIASASVR
jgi:hypothetical protein